MIGVPDYAILVGQSKRRIKDTKKIRQYASQGGTCAHSADNALAILEIEAGKSGNFSVLLSSQGQSWPNTATSSDSQGTKRLYFRIPQNQNPLSGELVSGVYLYASGEQVPCPPTRGLQWEQPGTMSDLPDWVPQILNMWQGSTPASPKPPQTSSKPQQTSPNPPNATNATNATSAAAVSGAPNVRIFSTTDLGNSERLKDMLGGSARYSPHLDKGRDWLCWDGLKWVPDSRPVERALRGLGERIREEASQLRNPDQKKYLNSWSMSSQGKLQMDAARSLFSTDPDVQVSQNELDARPDWFVAGDGLWDLSQRKRIPNNREYLLTQHTTVVPDFSDSKLWLDFLNVVFRGNQDTIRYVQRVFGYCLTGLTREQCVWFLCGPKNNGKTTLLNAIASAIGSYTTSTGADTFFGRTRLGAIARLDKIRMITVRELSPGTRINEEQIKLLAGEEELTGKFLYKEEFQFKPAGKLIVLANHFPIVSGAASWRRIRTIPMTYQIPAHQVNKSLSEDLEKDAGKILGWLMRGAQSYYANGRRVGDCKEQQDYRDQQIRYSDPIKAFVSQCCIENPDFQVSLASVYDEYAAWCRKKGRHPYTEPALREALSERDYVTQGEPTIIYGLKLAGS